MPDAKELLDVAELLLTSSPHPPTDALLRRSVSTAYYAVFHHMARRAADRFIGQPGGPPGAHSLIYRSFEHGAMKQVCMALGPPQLSPKLARQLARNAFSRDIQEFAANFVLLQEQRHLADYDPTARFEPADAKALIVSAAYAIAAFNRASPDEQTDVLALLMAKPR